MSHQTHKFSYIDLDTRERIEIQTIHLRPVYFPDLLDDVLEKMKKIIEDEKPDPVEFEIEVKYHSGYKRYTSRKLLNLTQVLNLKQHLIEYLKMK